MSFRPSEALRRSRRPIRGGLGGIAPLAAAALLAFGCGSKGEGTSAGASQDASAPVLLISLDTVRLDAVSDGDKTPNLGRFAAESVTFAGAYTEMPFTLTAHASLLTGLAPDVHQVLSGSTRLEEGWTTLAEVLKRSGYGTAAVVGSDWLDPRFGFDQGFESYVRVPSGLVTAEATTRRAAAAVDRILDAGKAPFVFVHYYDAHSDGEQAGNTRPYVASVESGRAECQREWCAPDGRCATGFLLWASHHAAEVPPAARRCLHEAYEAGVQDLDRAFGRLRAAWKARGLWKRALVVVTSDHGEEFGEHGQFIHAQTFQETLSIPLWIKLPEGEAPRRVSTPAQLADVMPTVLGALDVPSTTAMTGRNLLAGERLGASRLIVAQNKHRPVRYAAQRGPWKLVHDFGRDRSWLFHLESDPREESNVAEEHPDVVAGLLSALEARRSEYATALEGAPGAPEATEQILDAEALRRLESLGYVD